MHRNSSHCIPRALCFLLHALLLHWSGTSSAAPSPVQLIANAPQLIGIAHPLNGEALYLYSNQYNSASNTIIVEGAVRVEVDRFNRGLLEVLVNGQTTPVFLNPSTFKRIRKWTIGSGVFRVEIPRIYYERWPYRTITAELVDVTTGTVYSRDKISYYDLINEQATVITYPSDAPIIAGVSSQMTDQGLGHLPASDTLAGMEHPYLSMLPYPSLTSFNDLLTQHARRIAPYDDDSSRLHACIDLNDLDESRFRDVTQFPTYDEALALAYAYKATYDNQVNVVCPALGGWLPAYVACNLAAQNACVQDAPTSGDFELCVDQIEGDVQSLTIDEVDDLALAFRQTTDDASAKVESDVTVNGINGRINGYLRSLSVRWKKAACAPRPKASLSDQELINTDWINEWATCLDMELNYHQASTVAGTSGVSTITKVAGSPQQIESKQTSPGAFRLSGKTMDVSKGSCSLSFVNGPAMDMVNTFSNSIRDKLTETWYDGGQDTQEAIVLTRLLEPYNLGTVATSDYVLDAPFLSISSDAVEGMWLRWLTQAATQVSPYSRYRRNQQLLALATGSTFSANGTDHDGDEFDTSFTVATGFLNQVLNARAASDKLYFTFSPTWRDLASFGVTTPPGQSPSAPATLTGDVLEQFDSAFSGVGNRELEIVVSPTFDPIVFMPTDISEPLPATGLPTTYGIDSLLIVFKDKARRWRKRTSKEWLKLHMSFRDEGFELRVDEAPSAQYLAPALSGDPSLEKWSSFVVGSDLTGCLLTSPSAGSFPASCENRLERKITDLLKPQLRPTFIELLSALPAPQYFSASGEAPTPVHFVQQSRWQDKQYITLYGRFDIDYGE